MDCIGFNTDQDLSNDLASNLAADEHWSVRLAARAVIFDDNGRIALMHLQNHGVYKLPGGGVEPDESIVGALHREIQEEAGLRVELLDELGLFIEKRDSWHLFQISHCHLAHFSGEYLSTNLTQDEKESGFVLTWARDIDDAISMVRSAEAVGYDDARIKARDSLILERAKKKILTS